MSRDALKAALQSSNEELSNYSKLLARTVDLTTRTYNSSTADGTNASSLNAIVELLDHPFTTGKIRSTLTAMQKTLHKDASANLIAKRKAEDEALKALAPKTGAKTFTKKSTVTENEGQEITNPASVLGHT
jgi:hypothetical protein